MKEPVLQDKWNEHARFCRFATELTERVSGKPLLMGTDVSLARLQRANVVAQTRIIFSDKELLMLIRNHLVAKGLQDTANTLVREANLSITSMCPATPTSSSSSGVPRTCRLAAGIAARAVRHIGASPISTVSATSSIYQSPRSLISPHHSCSSSSSFTLPHPPSSPQHPVPHAQGSHPVGRILFTRERPVSHSSSGKKLCALKQKSDHGAFIQVSHALDFMCLSGTPERKRRNNDDEIFDTLK